MLLIPLSKDIVEEYPTVPFDDILRDSMIGKYQRMADAIQDLARRSGKPPMFYSLCQWGRVSLFFYFKKFISREVIVGCVISFSNSLGCGLGRWARVGELRTISVSFVWLELSLPCRLYTYDLEGPHWNAISSMINQSVWTSCTTDDN
jgi:hypothetical protein